MVDFWIVKPLSVDLWIAMRPRYQSLFIAVWDYVRDNPSATVADAAVYANSLATVLIGRTNSSLFSIWLGALDIATAEVMILIRYPGITNAILGKLDPAEARSLLSGEAYERMLLERIGTALTAWGIDDLPWPNDVIAIKGPLDSNRTPTTYTLRSDNMGRELYIEQHTEIIGGETKIIQDSVVVRDVI